ncbi:MAG: rod shape-determining protein MreD [Sphingomonadaceae bacterium]
MNPPIIKPSPIADRACKAIPAAIVFLAMAVMALPLPLAVGAMPHFAFLFVIIWAILQPRLMPVWVAFLLGVVFDLLSGQPLGQSSLLFAGAVATVRLAEDRFEGHSLAVDWLFTALVVLVAQLLSWQITSFFGATTALWPFLLQALTTIFAYPLAVAIAARVQQKILVWTA